MKILFPLKIAYQALRKHKARTALTVLGMVIGISSVITVMAAGDGFRSYVRKEIESFGTNVIQTEIKVPNAKRNSVDNATSMTQGVTITTLNIEDAEAIEKISYVEKVNVGLIGQEILNFEGTTKTAMIFGSDENFLDLYDMEIEVGRYIDKEDVATQSRIIVLGSKMNEKLFGESLAVGKAVKIRNKNYRVVGVLQSRGMSFGFDMDDLVIIPIKTLQKQIMGIDHISYISTWLSDEKYLERGVDDITEILRERHNILDNDPDKFDFSVTTMQEAMDMMDSIMGGISLLLMAIAGISLLVGGVGIMNIMYVSVSERTYEIGLRKAVGATQKNILNQFLIEAGLITFGGAIIGVALGALFAFLISVVAKSQGFDLPFSMSIESVLISVFVAVGIGMVFGLYPAKKAAKLDPIDALRQH
jgi:putative ABC transport system permease protein